MWGPRNFTRLQASGGFRFNQVWELVSPGAANQAFLSSLAAIKTLTVDI